WFHRRGDTHGEEGRTVSCRWPVAGCLMLLTIACVRTVPPPPPPARPATPIVAPEPPPPTLDDALAATTAGKLDEYAHILLALANGPDGSGASARDLANVSIDELTEDECVKAAIALDKAGRADLAASIRMRLLTTYPQGRFTEQTYAAAPIDTMNINDALVLARRLAAQDHYDEAIDLMRRIEQRDPK